MTDRPIIFSSPMVRALIEGRKTQTRRALNPQPSWVESSGRWTWPIPKSKRYGCDFVCSASREWHEYLLPHQLPYAVGDRLWVREAWARVGDEEDDIHACPDLRTHAYYRADMVDPERQRWRSPIHMPRWASRLTLTVTDVRVQRVQDISEEDAQAEGVELGDQNATSSNNVFAYQCIWDHLNAKRSGCTWSDDPWVVALTFSAECRNIDAMEVAA